MTLIACKNCGVVYDKKYLDFAEDIWDDDLEGIDPKKGAWNQDTLTNSAYVKCRVCDTEIFEDDDE